MDNTTADLMAKIDAMEERIAELEMRLGCSRGGVHARIAERFPEYMDKTRAAQVLGVTRATVYAMLSDGRLEQNALGKVLTRSVSALMQAGKPIHKHAWVHREALRMGADHQ